MRNVLAISASQRRDLREFTHKMAGCCFVSRQNLELTERQLAMKLPVARVMGNPFRKVLSDPLPWPDNEVMRLACVARFEVLWKGQDLLLEILSRPQWMKRSWTLSLFGEGPDLDHLKNAVGFFGLEKRVEFCGYVREVETIWKNHHLMVLPSRGEGLPLAILEAMMCGRSGCDHRCRRQSRNVGRQRNGLYRRDGHAPLFRPSLGTGLGWAVPLETNGGGLRTAARKKP